MIAQSVFNELQANNTYVLPDSVLDIIHKLCIEIGYDSSSTPTYVNQYNAASAAAAGQKSGPAPAKVVYDGRANYLRQQARKLESGNSGSGGNSNSNRTNNKNNGNGNDWKTKQKFSITKFAALDATAEILSEIRSELNKVSDKNWEARTDAVFKHINAMCDACELDGSDEDEAIADAFAVVFNAAVLNKSPATYAKIFEKLHAKYSKQIGSFIDAKWQEYKESMQGIVDVSETDYDAFCAFNTANTARKNKSALFAEIAKLEFIEDNMMDRMKEAISGLLQQVVAEIEYREKSKQVEEITENIMVLFQTLGNSIDKAPYMPTVAQLAAYKNGDKPGLSSRTRFKYADIK